MGTVLNISRRNVSALLVAFLSFALVACATVTSGTPTGARTATSPATSPSPGTGSPQQQAKADAAAILAAFVPPPGTRRLAGAPPSTLGVLSTPGWTTTDPDLVDDTSWWLVPAPASQVEAYEIGHLPNRFTSSATGGVDGTTVHTWTLPTTLPAGERQLMLTMARADATHTAVRVDAVVTWQPARPAGTFLPSGIQAVTVTAMRGGNDKNKPPAPVTVTDPARVQQLVSLVNGLPLFPPGPFSCPFDDGRGVQLAFLAKVGGPVLGTAFAKSNGCGGVLLVIGAGQPSMEHAVQHQTALGFGTVPAKKALAISGMRWKMFGYLPA
jgi:hypothetical protein